jgi:hypothetical protein
MFPVELGPGLASCYKNLHRFVKKKIPPKKNVEGFHERVTVCQCGLGAMPVDGASAGGASAPAQPNDQGMGITPSHDDNTSDRQTQA